MSTLICEEFVDLAPARPQSNKTIEALWLLTRPTALRYQAYVTRYLAALRYLARTKPERRYKKPFEVVKQSGGTRLIRPAKPYLRLAQSIQADWLMSHFPARFGDDYCYTGSRGVLAAVQQHLGSRYGLVVDLKNAFNYVTVHKLYPILDDCFYRSVPNLSERDPIINFMLDLATFENITPQGCVSTPYYFNLIARTIDNHLIEYCASRGLTYTRYVDNICISCRSAFDTRVVSKFVQDIIERCLFEVSWVREFENQPIEYLGTRIFADSQPELIANKVVIFCDAIDEALRHPDPNIYRRKINGILTWVHQVCGNNIPTDLWKRFNEYYKRVGKPPTSFARSINLQMFA